MGRRQWRQRGGACLAAVVGVLALVTTSPTPASALSPANSWRPVLASAHTGSWYATLYADGRFVTVGHGDTVAVSRTGVSWTLRSAPAGDWQSVAYGDGHFVALSSRGSGLQEMISSDGVHWRAMPGPSGEWTGVTYGEGRFVAVSALGQFITSSDGVTWQTTWVRSKFLLNSVAYGDGRFVAVDSGQGDALISLDGEHWSFYPITAPGTPWYAVSYGDGVFTAFSPTGLSASSMLGYTWATQATGVSQQMNGSTFGCGSFVASGQATGASNVILSAALRGSWVPTPVPVDTSADWTSVTFGANRFVAVDSSGAIASRHVAGYCGPSVPTPPRDVSGNIESGQVWTYQHPSTLAGGAPVTGYVVTISQGTRHWSCFAPVYYQPNCIIKGLKNRELYVVTTQARNRFGYSAPTDPQWVIPVAHWSLQVATATPIEAVGHPFQVQLTGVIANSEGIYPESPITVHVGPKVFTCVASPFGECLFNVGGLAPGRYAMWASYVGYGVYYRSPTGVVTLRS